MCVFSVSVLKQNIYYTIFCYNFCGASRDSPHRNVERGLESWDGRLCSLSTQLAEQIRNFSEVRPGFYLLFLARVQHSPPGSRETETSRSVALPACPLFVYAWCAEILKIPPDVSFPWRFA